VVSSFGEDLVRRFEDSALGLFFVFRHHLRHVAQGAMVMGGI
jgi:hypothetical protein